MLQTTIKNLSKKARNNFSNYIIGIIVSNGKKNCVNMANYIGVSHDSLYRFLLKAPFFTSLIPGLLVKTVKFFSKRGVGFLILDDTAISKPFASFIQGIDYIYSSSLGKVDKGFSIIVLSWSNGTITIPLGFKFWFRKHIIGREYKTKIELAQKLIDEYKDKILFSHLLADGLYCSKKAILFLCNKNIKFEMRIARNRVVTTNKIRTKLSQHPCLRLQKNQRKATQRVCWDGIWLYITAQKRKNKNQEYDIVFQASNFKASPEQHIILYEKRWEIEKLFRTAKQSLGLNDCAARDIEKQSAHIYSVFYSYALLQKRKSQKKKFKNIEEVVYSLRDVKFALASSAKSLTGEIFNYVA